jgi:hypothetical protein
MPGLDQAVECIRHLVVMDLYLMADATLDQLARRDPLTPQFQSERYPPANSRTLIDDRNRPLGHRHRLQFPSCISLPFA